MMKDKISSRSPYHCTTMRKNQRNALISSNTSQICSYQTKIIYPIHYMPLTTPTDFENSTISILVR